MLVLFFPRFFATALASQSFLDSLFLTGLQVEGVTLDLLDDVFLLHLTLEATKRVFEGFSLLNSYFCQTDYTPKLVPFGPDSYCKVLSLSQELCNILAQKTSFHHDEPWLALSKTQSQSELNLSRSVCASSKKQMRGLPEVRGEVIESSKLIDLDKLRRVAQKTIVVGIYTFVVTI